MAEPRDKEYVEMYNEARAGWSGFLAEAEMDTQMLLGAQFSGAEEAFAAFHGRSLQVFNRMHRQVALISGYEIRNRHSLKIGGLGREDDIAARQHTALVSGQMQQAEGYEFLSDAFRWGTLVSGSNLLELWRDRAGDLQFHRRGYNCFLLDPMLSRHDLSDCGYILAGQWLRTSAIKRLLPTEADALDARPSRLDTARWPGIPGRPRGPNDVDPTRLYEEYWRRETGFVDMIIDRSTGRQKRWSDFVRDDVAGDARRAGYLARHLRLPGGQPWLSKFQVPESKVKLTVFVDGVLVWDGVNPLGFAEYPFVWLHGDWIPEVDRDDLKLQSFCRILRDPQKARNKRLNQVCDMMEAQISNLRLMRQNSLVDPRAAFKSGPTVVEVKEGTPGALMDAFAQLPGPGLPNGVFQLLEVLDREDIHAGGLNEEIFGSDDGEIPGVLHRYRTGQALTGQQGMFTAYRQAKRRLGRLMVRFNQANMGPAKVGRMLNERPTPDFYTPDFVRYDCTPTEGLLTSDQQQLWYAELKELAAMYPQLIPGSEVLRAAPVAYPEELLRIVARSEQQQQQMMAYQAENQRVMNELVAAQSRMDIAQADENRAGAMADRVKAMVDAAKLQDSRGLEVLDRAIEVGRIQADLQKAREQAQVRQKQTAQKGSKKG